MVGEKKIHSATNGKFHKGAIQPLALAVTELITVIGRAQYIK